MIQRFVGSSSQQGSTATRLFTLICGVGPGAPEPAPREGGDLEAGAGALPPLAGGPLPLLRTSSQFSQETEHGVEEGGDGGTMVWWADGQAPAEVRRAAYEMYVGFCLGQAEEGLGGGRGAQLSAALSDSSLSSMLYTRRESRGTQHFISAVFSRSC